MQQLDCDLVSCELAEARRCLYVLFAGISTCFLVLLSGLLNHKPLSVSESFVNTHPQNNEMYLPLCQILRRREFIYIYTTSIASQT